MAELGTEAKNTIDSTGAQPPAAGLAGNDPAAMAAMEDLAKYRGSAGFAGKSALTGGAMGIQAAQGAMNPLSAFIQGAAAGLQAPAQVFAQKQAQVKSTLDAMPFGIRFPELAKRYPLLAGMPSALALEAMKGIAQDTAKVIQEHQAKTGEQLVQGEIDSTLKKLQGAIDLQKYSAEMQHKMGENIVSQTKDFNSKSTPWIEAYQGKTNIDHLAKMPDPNGANDTALLLAYAHLINGASATGTRFNENVLDTAASSEGGLAKIMNIPAQFLEGNKLTPQGRMNILQTANQLYNTAQAMQRVREHNALQIAGMNNIGFAHPIITGDVPHADTDYNTPTNNHEGQVIVKYQGKSWYAIPLAGGKIDLKEEVK